MKSFKLIMMLVLAFSAISLLAETKGPQLQRESYGVNDVQFNTISNFSFPVTNYGIYYLNVPLLEGNNAGGGYWPRGSNNQYIFASGFWFGAQKINKQTNQYRKLVAVSYNPNTGLSWYTPGRIEDGDTAITSLEKKYRIYFSTNFDQTTGIPNITTDGPNWPLWKITDGSNIPYASENSRYVADESKRDIVNNPFGPSILSGEDIVSVYKDTDLQFYEDGANRAAQGYPLRTEVESRIYTWGSDELKDVVVISFKLTNLSTDTLKDCWFGKIVDADLATYPFTPDAFKNDHIKYYSEDPSLNLLFAWTELTQGESPDFGYMGCSLLESPTVDEKGFIKKNQLLFPLKEQLGLKSARKWSLQEDKLTDSSRYEFLSEDKKDVDGSAGDNRMLLSTGPYNLKPGEDCRIAYTLIFANPVDRLKYDGSNEDINLLVQKAKLIKTTYYQGVSAVRSEEKLRAASTVLIYPNPAQDFINLESTGAEFIIYNINGKPVLSGIDIGRINISVLKSGLYLVLANDKFYKFVKE
ncbi:MAG: T9SS type A sorting domain-containing protein [bacterium]